jgi:hypothetical protein
MNSSHRWDGYWKVYWESRYGYWKGWYSYWQVG